jgi:hypothetical protein
MSKPEAEYWRVLGRRDVGRKHRKGEKLTRCIVRRVHEALVDEACLQAVKAGWFDVHVRPALRQQARKVERFCTTRFVPFMYLQASDTPTAAGFAGFTPATWVFEVDNKPWCVPDMGDSALGKPYACPEGTVLYAAACDALCIEPDNEREDRDPCPLPTKPLKQGI